jgi:hypothetical protein
LTWKKAKQSKADKAVIDVPLGLTGGAEIVATDCRGIIVLLTESEIV